VVVECKRPQVQDVGGHSRECMVGSAILVGGDSTMMQVRGSEQYHQY
jgi:hypothetical protein